MKPQAPAKAMGQLGSCLRHIIAHLANNCDNNNLFCFSKLDVKDSFWRMVVTPDDAWNFAYVLPPANSKKQPLGEIELVVPDALQMG